MSGTPTQIGSFTFDVEQIYIPNEETFYETVTENVVVPEPSTWAMMLVGFAGLSYGGYRRGTRFSLK